MEIRPPDLSRVRKRIRLARRILGGVTGTLASLFVAVWIVRGTGQLFYNDIPNFLRDALPESMWEKATVDDEPAIEEVTTLDEASLEPREREHLDAIKSAIEAYDPEVIDFARKLAKTSPGAFNAGQAAAIYDHLYNNWTYVNDPKGREYFSPASRTIAIGLTGDCDDFAILMASLVKAVGGTVRVSLSFSDSGGHAYTEVLIPEASRKSLYTALSHHYTTTWRRTFGFVAQGIVHYKDDAEGLWLNLDWWSKYAGGPYFPGNVTTTFDLETDKVQHFVATKVEIQRQKMAAWMSGYWVTSPPDTLASAFSEPSRQFPIRFFEIDSNGSYTMTTIGLHGVESTEAGLWSLANVPLSRSFRLTLSPQSCRSLDLENDEEPGLVASTCGAPESQTFNTSGNKWRIRTATSTDDGAVEFSKVGGKTLLERLFIGNWERIPPSPQRPTKCSKRILPRNPRKISPSLRTRITGWKFFKITASPFAWIQRVTRFPSRRALGLRMEKTLFCFQRSAGSEILWSLRNAGNARNSRSRPDWTGSCESRIRYGIFPQWDFGARSKDAPSRLSPRTSPSCSRSSSWPAGSSARTWK